MSLPKCLRRACLLPSPLSIPLPLLLLLECSRLSSLRAHRAGSRTSLCGLSRWGRARRPVAVHIVVMFLSVTMYTATSRCVAVLASSLPGVCVRLARCSLRSCWSRCCAIYAMTLRVAPLAAWALMAARPPTMHEVFRLYSKCWNLEQRIVPSSWGCGFLL